MVEFYEGVIDFITSLGQNEINSLSRHIFMKNFFTRFFATIGFMAVLPVFIFLALKLFNIKTTPDMPDQAVLTIDLGKDFPESPGIKGLQQLITGPTTTFFQLLRALSAAEIDDRVKGIILRLNPPQLGLAQLEELREALLIFRKRGKFIYVYADTFGDLSPGTKQYYIASCADKIWIQPFSSLNLTGLHVDQPFFGAVLKKFGIEPQIFSRKEYKNAYASFTDEEASDANREATTNLLQRLYDKLMGDIKTGRELSNQALKDITLDNPMMSDQEAQKANLIDHIGYIDQFKGAAIEKASPDKKVKPAEMVPIAYYADLLEEINTPQEEKIALIYGVGAIMQDDKDNGGLMGTSYIMGADETRYSFEAALKDPKVKAIVFRIDSPGGSAVASETVRHLIHLAHKKGVPVVASLGNVAASGGYWFAAPCKKVLASHMTITGSIGTLGGKMVFRELLENYDVNVSSMSVGDNGSLWSPLTSYTDDQKKHVNRTMDLLYARFIQVVSEGRGLSLDHVSEIAKGRVWTGTEAKEFGLIDDVGGLKEAFAVAQHLGGIDSQTPYEIVVYPKPKTLLEALQQTLSGSSPFSIFWKELSLFWTQIRLALSGQALMTYQQRL